MTQGWDALSVSHRPSLSRQMSGSLTPCTAVRVHRFRREPYQPIMASRHRRIKKAAEIPKRFTCLADDIFHRRGLIPVSGLCRIHILVVTINGPFRSQFGKGIGNSGTIHPKKHTLELREMSTFYFLSERSEQKKHHERLGSSSRYTNCFTFIESKAPSRATGRQAEAGSHLGSQQHHRPGGLLRRRHRGAIPCRTNPDG